jgi:hypothetical protein
MTAQGFHGQQDTSHQAGARVVQHHLGLSRQLPGQGNPALLLGYCLSRRTHLGFGNGSRLG